MQANTTYTAVCFHDKSARHLRQGLTQWIIHKCYIHQQARGREEQHAKGKRATEVTHGMRFTCLSVPGLLLMVLVLLSISNTKRGSKPFCQGWHRKEKEGREEKSEAKNHLEETDVGAKKKDLQCCSWCQAPTWKSTYDAQLLPLPLVPRPSSFLGAFPKLGCIEGHRNCAEQSQN